MASSNVRRTSLLHTFWCIPKSLCCSASYCRCSTCCAHAFSSTRITFVSRRWIYTHLSLVQSRPTCCNYKYLDSNIIFSLDIASHFSSTSHFLCPLPKGLSTSHYHSLWLMEASSSPIYSHSSALSHSPCRHPQSSRLTDGQPQICGVPPLLPACMPCLHMHNRFGPIYMVYWPASSVKPNPSSLSTPRSRERSVFYSCRPYS